MIGTENAIIREFTHHKVSHEGSNSIFNDKNFEYNEEGEEKVLMKLFLKPFVSHAHTFEFTHEVDINYNVLFGLVKKIEGGEDFIERSKDIVQHLLSVSKHPNIKEGDVFIVKFDDLSLGGQYYRGVGIYKFEEKESFLETSIDNDSLENIEINFRKGLGAKKPDKACLILLTEEPYTLLIIDSNSKETEYWQNDFIQQRSKNDNVNSTSNFLTLTKDYITSQVPEEFEVSKADQIDLLNKSVEYFKTRETFVKEEFEEEVLGDKNVIESFRKFDENFREEKELDFSDSFEISDQAVKKQARAFKSVLKLDKNFHIYIHGDKELIEKGVDEDGRKYYKVYYEVEK